ncbi:hypothetical protein HanPI659440_Chr08g0308561 [Helianthus annuus]|nr:hypothetical protein HanPI659440_Chr08g0308561 [Helianthus annuus]
MVFDVELVVHPWKHSKELLGFKSVHVNKQISVKCQADLHQNLVYTLIKQKI